MIDHSINPDAMLNFIAIEYLGKSKWRCACKHCKVEVVRSSATIRNSPDANCASCMLPKQLKDWSKEIDPMENFDSFKYVGWSGGGAKWSCICKNCKTKTIKTSDRIKMSPTVICKECMPHKRHYMDWSKEIDPMEHFDVIKHMGFNMKKLQNQWFCQCKKCKSEFIRTSSQIKINPNIFCKECMLPKQLKDWSKEIDPMENFYIIERDVQKSKCRCVRWSCICKNCKTKTIKTSHQIKMVPTVICKECMHDKRLEDLTGFKKGLMKVIKRSKKLDTRGFKSFWECMCTECGTLTNRPKNPIKNGKFDKCRCGPEKEVSNDPEWGRHVAMHIAAKSRNNPCTICSTWSKDKKGNEQRQKDMGNRLPGFSTDRCDDRIRHYSKDNCKYSCEEEQAENKMDNMFIKHRKKGNVRCLNWWARKLKFKRGDTLKRQIKTGLHPDIEFSDYSDFFEYKTANPITDYTVTIPWNFVPDHVYSTKQTFRRMCARIKHPRYIKNGVTVHPAWLESFDEFLEYMGMMPEYRSLDRIDGRLGYFPGNVRWTDFATQQYNKSGNVFYKDSKTGDIMPRNECARKMSLIPNTLKSQIKRGLYPNLTLATYDDYVKQEKANYVHKPNPMPDGTFFKAVTKT